MSPGAKLPDVERLAGKRDVKGLSKALELQRNSRDTMAELAAKPVRQAAAKALGQLGDRRAVKPLLAALDDRDVDVRRAAIDALGQIGDAQAVPRLLASARQGDIDLGGQYVARALGQMGDPRATDFLLRSLQSVIADTRYEAAVGLGKIGDPRALEPLIAALGDLKPAISYSPSRKVAEGAAEALVRLGNPRAVAPLMAAFRSTAGLHTHTLQTFAKALVSFGEPGLSFLRLAVQDEELPAQHREAAAETLGQTHDSRAADALLRALDQGNAAAAGALFDLSDRRAVPPLVRALAGESRSMRAAAAKALGRFGDPSATEGLISLLGDSALDVRREAWIALARIGDARAIQALVDRLQSSEWEEASKLYYAVASVGDSLPSALRAALSDWDARQHKAKLPDWLASKLLVPRHRARAF